MTDGNSRPALPHDPGEFIAVSLAREVSIRDERLHVRV
jgi:hypothetical protein